MEVRYYRDTKTGLPHIYQHGVSEQEVEEILERPGEDRPGYNGARVAIGQTLDGRYLRVIYTQKGLNDLFVITAYALRGKPLRAYKRRHRIKRQ
ncbi:MAG: DUF4258 domain-containing protein [Gammaproteobacteria bacterium]|nr:DUF4258 domain-containing protein [Gammaproteobacteria bacterium]MCY4210199.1 DUF4258 domain-containing protein [Gammaproteobacteria bacterium]MCY4281655.1 DUF4258 domain-containing protein [Gammaproteobacteria bacterium]